jgi:hypothetical protein
MPVTISVFLSGEFKKGRNNSTPKRAQRLSLTAHVQAATALCATLALRIRQSPRLTGSVVVAWTLSYTTKAVAPKPRADIPRIAGGGRQSSIQHGSYRVLTLCLSFRKK